MSFRAILVLFVVVLFSLNISSSTLAGLILNGINTIHTKTEFGFDFVQQKACTTFFGGINCANHFTFAVNGLYTQYELRVPSGYSINMNKINLDSIKSAPPDSVFYKQPLQIIDNISVDSLTSRIGNCYILKTGSDPRYNYALFIKMKILGFNIIDSANYEIEMKFLWVENDDGLRDLTSHGLDTFHLGTTGINQPNSQASRSINHTTNNQYVFKVVGDRFVLPRELVGKVKWLTVWDLRGRKLGRVEVGNENIVNLQEIIRGKGITIARVE